MLDLEVTEDSIGGSKMFSATFRDWTTAPMASVANGGSLLLVPSKC
jgi:hypothetical protein